jgi:hypothetical protein
MFKHVMICFVATVALVLAVSSANACPKAYHQCGSFCCGD